MVNRTSLTQTDNKIALDLYRYGKLAAESHAATCNIPTYMASDGDGHMDTVYVLLYMCHCICTTSAATFMLTAYTCHEGLLLATL